jgi:hypothetical protein
LNGEKVIVKGKEILKKSEDRVKEFKNWFLGKLKVNKKWLKK